MAIGRELNNLGSQAISDDTCQDFKEKFDMDTNDKIDMKEAGNLYLEFHRLISTFFGGVHDRRHGLMQFNYFAQVALPQLGLTLDRLNQRKLETMKTNFGYRNLNLDNFSQLIILCR